MLASVSIVDSDLSKGFKTGLARNGGWGKAVTWYQLYNLLFFLLERALRERGAQQRSR